MTKYKATSSKEEVDAYLRKIYANGHSMKTAEVPIVVYKNTQAYYGNWKNALNTLGLRREKSKSANAKEIINKRDIDAFINELINSDVKVCASYLLLNHPLEYHSIKHHYGSIAEAFTLMDVYVLDKAVPKKWTAEFLTSQIVLGYETNKQLNTDYIVRFAPSAEEFARKCFGSWRNAIISAGLPIEYVELDSQKASRDGHKFEEILGEILGDLGVNFRKYEHERWRPDFVVGNHWIDAKLSQWTVFNSDTVENYEPHCEELTIIFLRGDKEFDKKLTGKTRMVNVYALLKNLSEDKQRLYNQNLADVV